MFHESRSPAHLAPAPCSFAALMELYERNYIALRRLCPDLPELAERCVSAPHGAARLYLRVIERTRYTSTLELAQRLGEGETGSIPALPLRVYHDARQAEVLISGVHPEGLNCAADRDERQRRLAVCWEVNSFLNEWLKHCLQQGHRFDQASVTA